VGIEFSTPKEATMYRKSRNILMFLVIGLAVAAVAAPSALAEPRGPANPVTAAPQSPSPDDRSFNRGGAILETRNVSPDDRAVYRGVENPSQPVSTPVSSPDDRSLYRGIESPNQPVSVPVSSPDDRSFFRGVETPTVPVSVTISASDDFRWADAGLGAASTLALILLLGAGTLAVRHHRHRLAAY
jgi:hypothetical protein